MHVLIERKDENGNWQQVKLYRKDKYTGKLEIVDPYPGRCYDLFSILAGVRGAYDPIKYPTGVPQDMSDDVRKSYEYWEDDMHSATSYDMMELAYWVEKFKNFEKDDEEAKERYELLKGFYDDMVAYISFVEYFFYLTGVNQYRVIMWFDS